MAKSTNRNFQFIGSSKTAQVSGRLWYPAADVYQTPEGWVVKVELAGVSGEEIVIEIQGNTLYIAGSRKDRDTELDSGGAGGFQAGQRGIPDDISDSGRDRPG